MADDQGGDQPATNNNANPTDDTSAGAADKSTETTGKPASEEPSVSSTGADKGDDQATQEDKPAGQSEDEGAGDPASKTEDAKSSDKADKAKQNREAAKLRLAAKNENIDALRDQLQSDYVDQAEDDRDREIREIKADQYVERVRRVNEQIQRDNETAAREIDLFNPNSDSFNKDLLDRSLKRYARDCLTTAEDGKTITGYSIPLLDYLREDAEAYGYGSKTRTPQQKAADSAKMDAAADAPGGASAAAAAAKKSPEDDFDKSFLDGFDAPNARHKPANIHSYSG